MIRFCRSKDMGERNRRFLRPGSGEGEGKDMIDKILHPDAKMKKDESTPPPPRRGATLPPHTRSPPREQESLRDSLESRSTPVPRQLGKMVERDIGVFFVGCGSSPSPPQTSPRSTIQGTCWKSRYCNSAINETRTPSSQI